VALRLMIEKFIRNGKLVCFLVDIEPSPDRTEIDNLGIILLGTISAELHPLEMIGVKKIGLESITDEGRSREGKAAREEAGA
jgi:hypothetical protein